MLDLTQFIPLIKSLTYEKKLEHIKTWENNLREWQEDLKQAEIKGRDIKTYLEQIENCQTILRLLQEQQK